MKNDERENAAAGTHTILVVDDEQGVREFACLALERRGYRVRSAASGEAALQIFDEPGVSIALLVTDVRMPGMQGPDLAKHLRERQPSLPVVFITGYAVEGVLEDVPGPTMVLHKPFTSLALVNVVRAALGRDA
jgi:two-component system cell cycle sensor histidine kinase/response regulator CckA